MAITNATKMATALREVLKTIQMDIPAEANNNLRDFLFGEGEWQEPCPFCTKTYPEIIRRLKKKFETDSIGDFIKGKITDSTGVTTVALHDSDRPTFGGFDDMSHENLAVRLVTPTDTIPPGNGISWDVTISGAVNLEIADLVANHDGDYFSWYTGPNGKINTLTIRTRDFRICDMPTLQTLKLAIPEVYLNGSIGTSVRRVQNCENLRVCEITSLGERGWVPLFKNVKRGFTLDFRPIGLSKEDLNVERRPWERLGPEYLEDYWGLRDAMGIILFTDGEIEF